MNRRVLRLIVLAFVAVLLAVLPWQAARTPFSPDPVYANGFIDFEDGVDGEPIQSTIPGLRFTTTAGYDWVYGDWRTSQYNGKYPDGAYSSNGNFFAWLGPNQGDGRIEFIHGDATYLSLYVSADTAVTLQGYDANGTLIATTTLPEANTNTGRLDELRIEAPAGQRFNYALISAAANQWVIDDLSTDAAGVPDSRTPLIFLPGLAGTRINNNEGEVWPNSLELLFDLDDDSMLVLRLKADGETPFDLNDERYTSVATGDVIRTEAGQDFYQSMIDYFGQRGYSESDGTLVVFPYDWRKDMNQAVADLEIVIAQVKAQLGVDKVNLLGHSMGGLVARAYIADPDRASDVDTMVTLGTPYLGTPRAYLAIHYGTCFVYIGQFCISNEGMVQTLSQNFPGIYQLLPGRHYFRAYPDGYLNMDRDTDVTVSVRAG